MSRWRLVGYKKTGKDSPYDVALEVEHRFLWWRWLCTYVGSGTVWHKLPGFTRCGTLQEGILSEFWSKLRYEGSLNP